MPAYRITEKAGRFVAGRSNTGAGAVLFLTEKEAEYELNLGTIVLDGGDAGGSQSEAPAAEGDGEGSGEGEGGGAAENLSKMTKAELAALAEARGVTVSGGATKAEIIAALVAASEAGAGAA
jgi:hypothetical protein